MRRRDSDEETVGVVFVTGHLLPFVWTTMDEAGQEFLNSNLSRWHELGAAIVVDVVTQREADRLSKALHLALDRS